MIVEVNPAHFLKTRKGEVRIGEKAFFASKSWESEIEKIKKKLDFVSLVFQNV